MSLLIKAVRDILKEHGDVDESTVTQIVKTAEDSNVVTRFCGKDVTLSSTKRRTAYLNRNFPIVKPVEYILNKEKRSNMAYVPIKTMLQKLLNRDDVLSKALPQNRTVPLEYNTYQDGKNYIENSFLKGEEFKICLGLYCDDFEVFNPLGTSKKKQTQNVCYLLGFG